jgi:hypothetical protein
MTLATGAVSAPARYEDFDLMPPAGDWRAGRSGDTRADTDPWSGESLAEFPLAEGRISRRRTPAHARCNATGRQSRRGHVPA